MNSQPVFALYLRATRLDARSFATYARRGGLLGVIFIALLTAKQTSTFFGAPGLRFFKSVVLIDFFYITVTGISYFASAITEEKEGQTLGLLRLTALSPVAILLGKAVPRLAEVIVLLVMQMPFTLLAVTLGGVAVHQIVSAYLALIAYSVLLANIALFWSVLCKKTGNAAGLTVLCQFAFFALPLWGLELLKELKRDGILAAGHPALHLEAPLVFLRKMSVFDQLQAATSALGSTWSGWLFQVVSNLLLGGMFFVGAWLLFDRFTRVSSPARAKLFAALHARGQRRGLRRLLQPGRPWRSLAVAWRDFTYNGGIIGLLLRFFLIVGIVLLAQYVVSSLSPYRGITSPEYRRDAGTALVVISLILIAIEAAFAAAHIFADDLRRRTLGMLLLLPMNTGAFIRQKLLACALPLLVYGLLFALGSLLAPEALLDILQNLHHLEAWYMISVVVLGLYLTAYLSLVLKRGALGVTIVGLFLSQTILTMLGSFFAVTGIVDMETLITLLVVIYFLIAIALHVRIPGTLEKRAAEM